MIDETLNRPVSLRRAIPSSRRAPSTRGTLIGGRGPLSASIASLAELVKLLRDDVKGLPLSLVLHGEPPEPARSWFSAIRSRLRPDDVLWWVAPEGSAPGIDWKSLVHLRPGEPAYQNLYADVVFFPSVPAWTAGSEPHWWDESRVTLVDVRSGQAAGGSPATHQSPWFGWKGGDQIQEL